MFLINLLSLVKMNIKLRLTIKRMEEAIKLKTC